MVTHAKVSAKPDPADTSLVGATDWNALHSGSGSGLPAQWTDGGNGDVTATTDDGSAPITFDVTDLASNDAIVANVPYAGDISGNGYVLRIHDATNNWHVADIDAWGALLIRGPFDAGAGSGGIDVIRQSDGSHVGFFSTRGDFQWQALAADSTKSRMWMENVVVLRTGDVNFDGGHAGVGFFDKAAAGSTQGAAQQELTRSGVTAAQLWDVLEAYGLVKEP